MGTTEKLNHQLRKDILSTGKQQCKLIIDAAKRGAVPSGKQFVFFAAFDGTNNDKENAGSKYTTNVYQLFRQVKSREGKNLKARYYPGPGTKGALRQSTWLRPAVTQQVINTADKAFKEFQASATQWLATHARGTVTVALTGFSRGNASAAIFSQMLFNRGLVDPNSPGAMLVQPGQVTVAAGVLFDPVMTGVGCNLAFAPNATNLVQIRAQGEYRNLFMAKSSKTKNRGRRRAKLNGMFTGTLNQFG